MLALNEHQKNYRTEGGEGSRRDINKKQDKVLQIAIPIRAVLIFSREHLPILSVDNNHD